VELAAGLVLYYKLTDTIETLSGLLKQFPDVCYPIHTSTVLIPLQMVDLQSFVLYMMKKMTPYHTDLYYCCFVKGCTKNFSKGVIFAELRDAHGSRDKGMKMARKAIRNYKLF
jgi:hypothetical protein